MMSEPASYLASSAAEPVAVTVRVHDIVKVQGDLNGLGYVDRAVANPQIVFLAEEVQPVDRAVVELTDGRRYKIDTVLPQHGITITCDATRLKDATA